MVNIQCERLAELREAVATLTRELGEVQARYDKYRQLYRTQSRGEAVGQKLDSLKTRAGRVYDQVTIRQVYCDGMSISYDGGVVRLSVEDLGSSWAERFDWNVDEQLAARKAAELIPISSPGQSSSVQYGGKPNKAQSAPRSFNSPEADAYRNQMADLKNQLLDTRDRLESAVQQQATGKNRSVPGSLETWDSYVERLQRQQSLLRRQYASLRAKLLVLSPREPADKEVE